MRWSLPCRRALPIRLRCQCPTLLLSGLSVVSSTSLTFWRIFWRSTNRRCCPLRWFVRTPCLRSLMWLGCWLTLWHLPLSSRPVATVLLGARSRLASGLSRLLTRLVGDWGALTVVRRGLSHSSPDGLLDCYSSSPTFSQDWFCVGKSDVDAIQVWGVAACSYSGDLPSSVEMWLMRLSQIYRLSVWHYVVFILKLILSYLPVYLMNSLPSSPPLVGYLGFGTDACKGWGVLLVGSNHSARRM